MKHLEPEQIAAYADGLRPEGEDARHLRACRDCQGELRALRSLTRALAWAPAPPAALRQATLERLGLRQAPRGLKPAGLRWAAFLVSALALAWVLPLPKPFAPKPETIPAQTARPAPPPAEVLELGRAAKADLNKTRLARAPIHAAPVEIARAIPSSPALKPADRAFETGPTRAGEAAVGGAAPLEDSGTAGTLDATVLKGGAGSASTPLSLGAIRGNLIRPGQGGALNFTINLGQNGQVKVSVLNDLGRPVATLFDDVAGPGVLNLSWNGDAAPSGTYTILIHAGTSFQSFKALVIR